MTPGEELFCRYSYHPNQLGYCGPSEWDGLDVRAYAQGFAGAWAYLQVIAEMMGRDPLDELVVRTYWIGTDEGDALDATHFFTRLLEIIGPQAGGYWGHLGEDGLVDEASPSHAFHVLGIYPWSRLLDLGPEAVGVLNNCLLRPAKVELRSGEPTGDLERAGSEASSAAQTRLVARTRKLVYRGGQLEWAESVEEVEGLEQVGGPAAGSTLPSPSPSTRRCCSLDGC